ncbi:MAG: YbaB/EbfC family nucleoid-associated protein [Acidobacteria bacterium]|nr:YbaB/EbfC family nucleoid-associated protein [Acidobacteriota bacterium]
MDFDMNKMGEMLAQAQEMQQQMEERLAQIVVEADAGGGAVSVRMSGKKELLSVTIAPSAASAAATDLSLLEDLIVAAVNSAARKADEASNSNASSMLGGLGLPGF